MNSPPTPPYCGSVAAALHLMNSQCGSYREKVLFIALRWMQPDRGMMWQAENPELAREFPACTASKARQSRLHQAQGVFPVFVFHSFVRSISEHFVFQKQFFSPLMLINCLINCPIHSEHFCTFLAFRVQKPINGFLMHQFMNINVSKRRLFRPSSFVLRPSSVRFRQSCRPKRRIKFF